MLSRAKTDFAGFLKNEAGKAKYSLLKEAGAIKNKYLLLSAAQTPSKAMLKHSIEKERIEELMHETNAWTIFFAALKNLLLTKKQECAWLRSEGIRNKIEQFVNNIENSICLKQSQMH